MTQFVEQLRNQAKWYAQPGHNARDLMDSHLLEKAADEIESLDRYRTAYNEWTDKTEWMQKSLPAKYLGMHRADALKDLISELFDRLEAVERERDAAELMSLALRAKIAAMEKQEPVATIRINSITGNPSVDFIPGHRYLHHNSSLYALPGAKGEEK